MYVSCHSSQTGEYVRVNRALLHAPSEPLIGHLKMVVFVSGICAGKDKAYKDVKVTCHIATTENAFQDAELQQVSEGVALMTRTAVVEPSCAEWSGGNRAIPYQLELLAQ